MAMSCRPAQLCRELRRFAQSCRLQVALDKHRPWPKAWGDVQLTPTTFIVTKARRHVIEALYGSA